MLDQRGGGALDQRPNPTSAYDGDRLAIGPRAGIVTLYSSVNLEFRIAPSEADLFRFACAPIYLEQVSAARNNYGRGRPRSHRGRRVG
jgi:hypothetical protein